MSGSVRLPRLFRLPGRFRLPGLLFVLCGLNAACGQKGAPLAPIVYLPRPVTEVAAKRTENEVVLQFTVPTLNTDNTGPADLRRIEVWGHTGPLPAPADFFKYGTLVASIDIKQPPSPEELEAQKQKAESKPPDAQDAVDAAGGTTPAPVEAPGAKSGPVMVEQGWTTSVRETLTAKHMEIGPMPPTRPLPAASDDAPAVVVEKLETPGTVNFEFAPLRFYTIVGVSDSRGRRGPIAGPIQVELLEPLSPPEKVDLDYSADVISLSWPGQPEDREMPAGALGAPGAVGATDVVGAAVVTPSAAPAAAAQAPPPVPLPSLDRETEGTIEFFADVETDETVDVLVANIEKVPTGATPKPRPPVPATQPPPTPRFGYNVYEAPNAPNAPNAPSVPSAPIKPLNTVLLTAPGFSDPRVEFGTERCYVVRRVQMAGAVAIESPPSAPACVTPVDTFPPAAPKSLAHIAGANGVSLLWEANAEPDLGGYLVLRGEAPGDKLSPLTPSPISDTSFLDTTALRGRTYVYEVVAVDQSTPPNRSAPSNRVEETIR